MKEPIIETRIRQAGILICAGLAVQLASLFRIHPLSFVVSMGLGCPLTAAGVLLYLISLVSPEAAVKEEAVRTKEAAASEGGTTA